MSDSGKEPRLLVQVQPCNPHGIVCMFKICCVANHALCGNTFRHMRNKRQGCRQQILMKATQTNMEDRERGTMQENENLDIDIPTIL